MALPSPGTFSSLSAETPCYTYNWNNNIGEARTINYTDCNGASASQAVPATLNANGSFCARSTQSVAGGGVSVDQAGSCPCKTWYNRVFNSAAGRQYTFGWIDCNGQYAQRKITIPNAGPTEASFWACSKSKPKLIISGGPGDLDQRLEYQYCNREYVG